MKKKSPGRGKNPEALAVPPDLAVPFAPTAVVESQPAPPRKTQARRPKQPPTPPPSSHPGSPQPEPADPDAAVVAFLAADPGFFVRHPDLVASLNIPHPSGPAISLVEHQVGILRGQLEEERRRLAHIIARAREYEGLSSRLHGLTLALIAAPDRARVEEILHEAMCRELNAQCVTLKLFALPADAAGTDPLAADFHDFLDRRHCLCGPLDPERSQLLFGDFGAQVRSAALIPIHAGGRSGVLAIGSGDPARFRPDMATDILDRMGEVVGHRLQTLDHGHDH